MSVNRRFRGRETRFYIELVYGLLFIAGFAFLAFEVDPRVAAFEGGLVVGYLLRVWEKMSIYERILEEAVSSEAESQVATELEEQVPDEVAAEVEERVGEEVSAEVEERVQDEVAAEVEEQVGEEVAAEVEEQVGEEVAAEVEERFEDEVDERIDEQVTERLQGDDADAGS